MIELDENLVDQFGPLAPNCRTKKFVRMGSPSIDTNFDIRNGLTIVLELVNVAPKAKDRIA